MSPTVFFFSLNVVLLLACSRYHILCILSSEWSTIYLTNSLLQDVCFVSSLSLFQGTHITCASGALFFQAGTCWVQYRSFGFAPILMWWYQLQNHQESVCALSELSNPEGNCWNIFFFFRAGIKQLFDVANSRISLIAIIILFFPFIHGGPSLFCMLLSHCCWSQHTTLNH